MLVLASASPRRRELLAHLSVEFDVKPVDIDETPNEGEPAREYVLRMAKEKAQAGYDVASATLSESVVDQASPLTVLGSDTIVVLDGKILLKPIDENDAVETLLALSGKTHQVMTAIATVTPQGLLSDVVTTQVTFRALTRDEAIWYWNTGEPADKAGSYGIQNIGGRFVSAIDGSYSSVVGLPLVETEQLLRQAK